MFYPDKKPHMSPSALDAWLHNRSLFVRSYFEGEKTPETAAMTAGKKIHMLLEAGLMKAKKAFEINEEEIVIDMGNGVKFLGRPDGREDRNPKADEVGFVDYKTGKANGWPEKLPTDVKMRATAWLVWKASGEPGRVDGYIEFLPTEWDPVAKEVIAKEDAESEVVHVTYSASELEQFTKVILRAMEEVNAFYEKWLKKTDAFMNQDDVDAYAEVRVKIADLEKQQEILEERLLTQMQFGGVSTLPTPAGTIYLTEKKTYEYPLDLEVEALGKKLTLEQTEEVNTAAKVAKKNYELIAEPKDTKWSVGFRKAR